MAEMTLSITLFQACLIISGLAIGALFFWPRRAREGDYDFTPVIREALILFATICIILITWMVYFALT
jgi:hypothetical protein